MAVITNCLPYYFHFEIAMLVNQPPNNISTHFEVIIFNSVLTTKIKVEY